MTRGCWIDLFESPEFTGKMRRLFGPANYANVRGEGTNWDIRIQSLIAGPSAYVRLFMHQRPDRTLAWLLPGQSLADLAGLKSQQEFNSLRLLDRPPFTHEPGYAAYLEAAESITETPSRPKKKRRRGRNDQ